MHIDPKGAENIIWNMMKYGQTFGVTTRYSRPAAVGSFGRLTQDIIIIIIIIIIIMKIMMIIIIVTLFQENNIFGTNASLQGNFTYLQYVQRRWGLRTPSILRAGYPTLLAWRGVGGWGDTICPGSRPTGYSEIVTEYLLTRSTLINMYIHDIYMYLQSPTFRNFLLIHVNVF